MRSGELDYVDVPAASFDQYKDKATAWYTGGKDYLQINLKCGNAALANQNFRKALSYGIDRNALR
jgi:ABC-type transport system substrate-binding protein